jgi:YfiH family protein
VYSWRSTCGPVDLAFTDRAAGDLALDRAGREAAPALERVVADFAPGAAVGQMRQVHGAAVAAAVPGEVPDVDALVTAAPGVVLVVRVADCVPVLLADPDAGVVGAVHAGRSGMVAGVVPAAVERMRAAGARTVRGWLGPHVCGACYEVPLALQQEVVEQVPAARATTSWGTPALDLGAGVRTQLEALEVEVVDVGGCTRESSELYSYRREGRAAGRQAGLVGIRA